MAGFVVVQNDQTLLILERRGDDRIDRLPSAGTMLSALTDAAIDAQADDRDLPGRQRSTLY